MTRFIKELMEDLGQYGKTAYELRTLRRPGMGPDYRAETYREWTKRAVEAIHPTRMRLRVTQLIQETPTAKTFRMARMDGEIPPFRAGQYVNLYVDFKGVLTSRPFSISSRPGLEHLDLTARDTVQGFVSPYLLENIHVGDSLDSSGPAGSFHYEPLIDGEDLVFIAGGSGITPFMSMIRDFAARDWPVRITLFYGSRHPRDVIFGKELQALAKTCPRFQFYSVLSDPPKNYRGRRGLLDAGLIEEGIGDPIGKTFYLCGPNAMYDFCLPELGKLDVPRHKIKRELYGPPDDVTRLFDWPGGISPDKVFEVKLDEKTIFAKAGESLIASLERHGIVVPALCRSGECSACRTKLISGHVYMPPTTGLRQADAKYGYIHACVAYPLTNLEIHI